MADRDELERRVSEALEKRGEQSSLEWGRLDLTPETYRALAAWALDALGLKVEEVWDTSDPEVWERVEQMPKSWDGPESLDGMLMDPSDPTSPATDEQLRALGLVKRRRLVSPWEEIDD